MTNCEPDDFAFCAVAAALFTRRAFSSGKRLHEMGDARPFAQRNDYNLEHADQVSLICLRLACGSLKYELCLGLERQRI